MGRCSWVGSAILRARGSRATTPSQLRPDRRRHLTAATMLLMLQVPFQTLLERRSRRHAVGAVPLGIQLRNHGSLSRLRTLWEPLACTADLRTGAARPPCTARIVHASDDLTARAADALWPRGAIGRRRHRP